MTGHAAQIFAARRWSAALSDANSAEPRQRALSVQFIEAILGI
jgi:hypothetical protein